jgi:hypothetical protein
MSEGMNKVDMQVMMQQAMMMLGQITNNDKQQVSGAWADLRNDSWANFNSGIGTSDDKSEGNTFTAGYVTPGSVFEAMYRQDGISKTIIKAPAKDATKNWVKITEDTDNKILNELKRVKAKQAFSQLVIHARKFGGGAILIQTKMGDALDQPIDLNSATEIQGLKNFHRYDFEILESDINRDDPADPNYEEVELFRLRKRHGIGFVEIHRSRLVILKGEQFDEVNQGSGAAGGTFNTAENEYWGGSVLEAMLDALGYYGLGMKAISTMMQEATIGKFLMAGLQDLLADMSDSEDVETQQKAWKKFNDRIKAMVMTKSVIHSILLDAEAKEDFKREQVNFSGIPEVMNLNQMQISGMSSIPITKLFGRSPGGENATGESDAENYNSLCIGIQEDIEPGVQFLVDLITKGESKNIVDFNHPKMPTEEELLSMKKTQSEIDKIYVADTGILGAEEVRASRFGGEEYSFDTSIQSDKLPPGTTVESVAAEDAIEVQKYLGTLEGVEQKKLDEKIDYVIDALKIKGFHKLDEKAQYDTLKAVGHFTEEQIQRILGA